MATDNQANQRKSRLTLYSFFAAGSKPASENFVALIDSGLNRVDDGVDYAPKTGLQVAAAAAKGPALSLYADRHALTSQQPAWLLALPVPAGQLQPGLSFQVPPAAGSAPTNAPPALFLHPAGRVGVGTSTPAECLDVRGTVASQGRIGTYQPLSEELRAQVKADGDWHRITDDLNGLYAFEVVAAAYGPAGSGRYAITYAVALSAFGRSRSRIFRRSAWFAGRFQKIRLRWQGTQDSYYLEIKTASNFGEGNQLLYHITRLFDNRGMPAAPPTPASPTT